MRDILERFNLFTTICLFLIVPILAATSAYCNVKIKDGSQWAIFITLFLSIVLTITWVGMIRHGKMSLSVLSVLYDIIYSCFYFFSFVYLGEKATFLQWIGVAISIIGMVFMTI